MATTQELLAGQKAQLREKMDELRAKIAAIKANSAAAQAALDALIAQRNALDEQIASAAAGVDVIEQPALHDLKLELAAVAGAEAAIKL